MLTTLGIEASRSRPRVSNDNAFSESGFKTLKYQPDFPGRFRDPQHARSWMREFAPWYNEQHRHEGLNGFRSEEHTSELQSLMRISYAVFCLKKKNKNNKQQY